GGSAGYARGPRRKHASTSRGVATDAERVLTAAGSLCPHCPRRPAVPVELRRRPARASSLLGSGGAPATAAGRTRPRPRRAAGRGGGAVSAGGGGGGGGRAPHASGASWSAGPGSGATVLGGLADPGA